MSFTLYILDLLDCISSASSFSVSFVIVAGTEESFRKLRDAIQDKFGEITDTYYFDARDTNPRSASANEYRQRECQRAGIMVKLMDMKRDTRRCPKCKNTVSDLRDSCEWQRRDSTKPWYNLFNLCTLCLFDSFGTILFFKLTYFCCLLFFLHCIGDQRLTGYLAVTLSRLCMIFMDVWLSILFIDTFILCSGEFCRSSWC